MFMIWNNFVPSRNNGAILGIKREKVRRSAFLWVCVIWAKMKLGFMKFHKFTG